MAFIIMKRIFSSHWSAYELIDAGNNKKLERFGNIITIRSERNAYFKPILSYQEWKQKAHFEFVEESNNKGGWKTLQQTMPKEWQIGYKSCIFNLKLTKFKHIGIFPEQQSNWDFIAKHLKKGDKFLNLFAYTGGASLVANVAGAEVFHCDSVKQVISWSKKNMENSHQNNIHWVLDDALKFAAREVKRDNKYKGIIMDPPAYGIGANKERWKIETKFPELVKVASQLLSKSGFLIINTYSPKLKEEVIQDVVEPLFPDKTIEINKLSIKSTTGKILEFGELTRIY